MVDPDEDKESIVTRLCGSQRALVITVVVMIVAVPVAASTHESITTAEANTQWSISSSGQQTDVETHNGHAFLYNDTGIYKYDSETGDFEDSVTLSNNYQPREFKVDSSGVYAQYNEGHIIRWDLDLNQQWENSYGSSGSDTTSGLVVGEDSLYSGDGLNGWYKFNKSDGGTVSTATFGNEEFYAGDYDNGYVYADTDNDGDVDRVEPDLSDRTELVSTANGVIQDLNVTDSGTVVVAGDNFLGEYDLATGNALWTTAPQSDNGWSEIDVTDGYVFSAESTNFTKVSRVDGDFVWEISDAVREAELTSDESGVISRTATGVVKYDLLQPAAGEYEGGIEGVVSSEEGDPLSNVTVNASQNGSVNDTAETNSLGQYELSLQNGTYNVTASKQGWFPQTETVEVQGDIAQQDFSLRNFSAALQIDTRPFLEHGESAAYSVIYEQMNGSSGRLTRTDVTDFATVTSGDPSVVTINNEPNRNRIEATGDTSVNNRTYIEAEYSTGGETYRTRYNVTVANETVNNLDILPPVERFSSSLSGGTDANPNDRTILLLIIGAAAGAAASLIATSFAGVAALTMTMMIGWIMGATSNGMAIVTVFISLFVGLNLSAQIDYTIRK